MFKAYMSLVNTNKKRAVHAALFRVQRKYISMDNLYHKKENLKSYYCTFIMIKWIK